MIEVQQAHAVHRFILKDEEDEKPRILIWLFNPSVKISFNSAKQYTLPTDNSVLHVAKVLFFIVGPDFSLGFNNKGITEKYPSFANSETLLYPLNVCTRLAAMLKESNLTYPEERKSMVQLDVGYLQRS
ncbi:hypothetical protein FRC03_008712 [Tulasnella sp. 419]|nr:hypothetical protein FRC03_008712 [Tulasnella sp. 419]